MRLVDHEQPDLRLADALQEPRRGEPLGRDVEQPHVAGHRALDRPAVGRGVLLAVDERHPPGRDPLHRLHLVLHQRHQRRDDQREVRAHQRRQLVAERLARARGHHHQHVAPGQARLDRLPLARPERLEAEQLPQRARPDRSRARRARAAAGRGPGGRRCPRRATSDRRPYRRFRRPRPPRAAPSRSCHEVRVETWRARYSAGQRERVLERVLGLRLGRPGQRVVAREARVAVRLARAADRLVDAAQREVGQRVARRARRRPRPPCARGRSSPRASTCRRRSGRGCGSAAPRSACGPPARPRRAASARSGGSCCRARSSRRRPPAACRRPPRAAG